MTMFAELTPKQFKASGSSLYQRLKSGEIIVFRSVPEVFFLREVLGALVGRFSGRPGGAELQELLENRSFPRAETLHALKLALKRLREIRCLSAAFVDFVYSCGFPAPVAMDGGIHRLVLPPETLSNLRLRTDLFDSSDFLRERPDGMTETFMPVPSPPHRDLNRSHYTFQANFWFPLHDIGTEQSIILFPEAYRSVCTPVNIGDPRPERWGLGAPLRFQLGLGDALAFHSEHYHASPIRGAREVRFSYDLRVVSNCYDDNRSYCDNFWNLNNFLPVTDDAGSILRPGGAPSRALLLLGHAEEPRPFSPMSYLERNGEADNFSIIGSRDQLC